MISAASAGIYYWKHRQRAAPAEFAYILPDTVSLKDSPAEVRLDVAELHHGDRVGVLSRTTHWARIEIDDGREGWIRLENLIDEAPFLKGQALLGGMQKQQAQASGRTNATANLRVEPTRDAAQFTQLDAGERVEVFERRVVDRPPQPGVPEGSEGGREAWYLVRASRRGGWVRGRLISLEIPEEISHYAQNFNLVAWQVINTVDDNGRAVPQYVAADREGSVEYDFTRIRVFTWGIQRQEYATAYVESRLAGFFPIRVEQVGGEPCFRLRLETRGGKKVQKVYRLQDTIVRPLGLVDGWESRAMPEQPPRRGQGG